jgi:hypothetical protein
MLLLFFVVAQHPNLGLGHFNVEDSTAHKIRRILITRRRGRNLHNAKETQDENIHDLSRIRTRNSRNRGSADLHVRPYGRWDRPILLLTVGNYEVNCLGGFLRHNQHSKCAIWPAESYLKWDNIMQHGSFVNLLLFLPKKEKKWVNKEGWQFRQVCGSGKNTNLL